VAEHSQGVRAVSEVIALPDLRMDSFIAALCQEAERVQSGEPEVADLLWEAGRRLENVQKDIRLLARVVDA
jgi:hypothetical protein